MAFNSTTGNTNNSGAFSFGQNNQASNATAVSSNGLEGGLFGKPASTGGSTLFGNTQQPQNTNPSQSGSSLFGQTNSNKSLYGQAPQENKPTNQLGSALQFGSNAGGSILGSNSNINSNNNSFFSQSSTQSPNALGQSIFGLSGSTQLMPANTNDNIANPAPLTHSQSAMGGLNLSTYAASPRVQTPSWGAKERTYIPAHMSQSRQKSSFSSPDRPALASTNRHASISQSPPTFGQSFGTPKPAHAKRSNVIDEEDLPPTESIYDISNKASPSKPATYSSGLRRSESVYSVGKSGLAERPSEDLTANSIIVFGFPPSLASSVIKHFSRFGEILENVSGGGSSSPSKTGTASLPVQSGSNWIKITYKNIASAQRALGENNSIFADQYLIGCTTASSTNSRELSAASAKIMNSTATSEDNEMMDLDSPPRKVSPSEGLYPAIEGSESSKPQKTLPRTVSMPVLAGGKRIQVQNNRSIFDNKRSVRFMPSMANVKESADHKVKGKQGWLSWANKRAQELVFGWDDL